MQAAVVVERERLTELVKAVMTEKPMPASKIVDSLLRRYPEIAAADIVAEIWSLSDENVLRITSDWMVEWSKKNRDVPPVGPAAR